MRDRPQHNTERYERRVALPRHALKRSAQHEAGESE
jgi:hypothetical protein